MSNPSQESPASSKGPNQDLKDMDVLCSFKIKIESQNLDQGCIKYQWPYPNQDQHANPSQESLASTNAQGSAHIQMNIKMQNTSQDPPASSKTQNLDLKDMDVLCNFEIKIES